MSSDQKKNYRLSVSFDSHSFHFHSRIILGAGNEGNLGTALRLKDNIEHLTLMMRRQCQSLTADVLDYDMV